MKFANITLGQNVEVDTTTTINNVAIANDVKIAKRCSIFGGPNNILQIGQCTYIGMNSIVNGFAAQVTIGSHVSIAQNVNIMADSGPNASPQLQKIFPIKKASVTIGNHCWLGASVIIMPAVQLGDYCIVAANSYVNTSFAPYSIIGGTPAKLIRSLTQTEINVLINNDKVS